MFIVIKAVTFLVQSTNDVVAVEREEASVVQHGRDHGGGCLATHRFVVFVLVILYMNKDSLKFKLQETFKSALVLTEARSYFEANSHVASESLHISMETLAAQHSLVRSENNQLPLNFIYPYTTTRR